MKADHALSTARQVADELARDGAEAVVLVGSHARGDALRESDLDILGVAEERVPYRLERRGGYLVSVSVGRPSDYREAFADPGSVCAAVPGWREAMALHDPRRLAASLMREAREWSWEPLERRCDGWVAEEVTGYAEEVHKLFAALRGGNRSTAAVQRSLLASRLATILAVHERILYGSENRLWDLVSDAMDPEDPEWRRAQSAALGLDGEPFEETCGAALRLYDLAADRVGHLFDERQREVVGYARELAGRWAFG